MDEALAAGEHDEWADLNTRFHLDDQPPDRAMPLLQEMTERVLARWDRVRRYYFNGVLVHRVEQAQGEHRELLRADESDGSLRRPRGNGRGSTTRAPSSPTRSTCAPGHPAE